MTDSIKLEYVGFWLRVWASIIDTFLVGVFAIPLLLTIYGKDQLAEGVTITGYVEFLVSYILPAIVVIVFWSVKDATPGKMVIGAKIVDAQTGGPPSFTQHIVRYLGYFVSTLLFFLGFIWIAFDKKKQGWHDKFAGTVVVRPMRSHTKPVQFEPR